LVGLYAYLYAAAFPRGFCRLSGAQLGEWAGRHRDTVRRWLAVLEDLGVVRVERQRIGPNLLRIPAAKHQPGAAPVRHRASSHAEPARCGTSTAPDDSRPVRHQYGTNDVEDVTTLENVKENSNTSTARPAAAESVKQTAARLREYGVRPPHHLRIARTLSLDEVEIAIEDVGTPADGSPPAQLVANLKDADYMAEIRERAIEAKRKREWREAREAAEAEFPEVVKRWRQYEWRNPAEAKTIREEVWKGIHDGLSYREQWRQFWGSLSEREELRPFDDGPTSGSGELVARARRLAELAAQRIEAAG